ncbi:MAG: bile acid:sodium symporter family protein [Chitinophagales bacterium]
MKTVAALSRFLGRWMVLLTPAAMVAGWLWQKPLAPFTGLSTVAFAIITLALSLGTSWRDLGRVTLSPLPVVTSLLLLHLVAPLFGWVAWHSLFASSPDIGAGLVMATAIPIGVSSLLWASLAGGDLPLALALVTLDTLLSPLVVPLTIHLFVGQRIHFAVSSVMLGLFKMVVIPTLIGVTSHDLTQGRLHRAVAPYADLASKGGIIVAVALSVAGSAARLPGLDQHYLPALVTLFVLCVLGYFAGYLTARLLGWARPVGVSLAYCTGLRNTVAGTVVAATYFPPRVALTVCLMMLFQQPLAGFAQRLLSTNPQHSEAAAGKS